MFASQRVAGSTLNGEHHSTSQEVGGWLFLEVGNSRPEEVGDSLPEEAWNLLPEEGGRCGVAEVMGAGAGVGAEIAIGVGEDVGIGGGGFCRVATVGLFAVWRCIALAVSRRRRFATNSRADCKRESAASASFITACSINGREQRASSNLLRDMMSLWRSGGSCLCMASAVEVES